MADESAEMHPGIRGRLGAWLAGIGDAASDALAAYRDRLEAYKTNFIHWWNGDIPNILPPSRLVATSSKTQVIAPRSRKQEISARAIVSQALWGHGNLTPGTAEFITGLAGRLGLNAEMSMLDIGAGLGGPSRAINHAYGIWITAYEAIDEHVAAGMEQSVMQGMAKKVPVLKFDPEAIEIPKHKFDCIFSKEMMHHIKDKQRLIKEIQSGLKPQGQFFIINYVTNDPGGQNSELSKWNQADGQTSNFWSKEKYAAAFAAAGLDLRVTEDLTEQYCTMIANGFRGLKQNMESLIAEETDPERQSDLRRALAFESNRWAVRAEALHAKEVSVVRFSGMNPNKSEIR